VGRRFIPAYFEAVRRLLKPGEVGLLHTIGTFEPLPTNPWIEKYVFPGGYVPTLVETIEAMSRRDLPVCDLEDLRRHYGETLDHWHARFSRQEAAVEKIASRKRSSCLF
jgi:cyclopropane-fatty-acyl-phospholipid synthase